MNNNDEYERLRTERERIALERERIELDRLKQSLATRERLSAGVTKVVQTAKSEQTKKAAIGFSKLIVILFFGLIGLGSGAIAIAVLMEGKLSIGYSISLAVLSLFCFKMAIDIAGDLEMDKHR